MGYADQTFPLAGVEDQYCLPLWKQAVFVIYQREPAGRHLAPCPEDEVEIITAYARSEAPDEQSMIAGRGELSSKGLCCGFLGRFHLISPGRIGENGHVHALRLQGCFIPTVETLAISAS